MRTELQLKERTIAANEDQKKRGGRALHLVSFHQVARFQPVKLRPEIWQFQWEFRLSSIERNGYPMMLVQLRVHLTKPDPCSPLVLGFLLHTPPPPFLLVFFLKVIEVIDAVKKIFKVECFSNQVRYRRSYYFSFIWKIVILVCERERLVKHFPFGWMK